MAAIGGSLVSANLDGRNFPALADADVSRKLGGKTNEVQPNGDGQTARLIQTATAWSFDGLGIQIDDDNGDQEFLQALADRKGFWPAALTYASGAVYSGSGQISGDLVMTNQNTAAALNLMGQGKLEKQ